MEELVKRILADAPTKGVALMADTFRRLIYRPATYVLIAIMLLPNIGAFYWHRNVDDLDVDADGDRVIREEYYDEGYLTIEETKLEKKTVQNFLSVFYGFFLRLMLLVVTLSLATSLIQDEKEDKTLPLLMTGPLTRFEIVFYKYAAAVPLITAIVWAPTVIFYFFYVSAAGSAAVFDNLGLLGISLLLIFLSVAAYTAVYFAITAALKHPLMGGTVFTFLWEFFVGEIGHTIQKITITHYVRSSAVPLLSEFTSKNEALQTLKLLGFQDRSLATGWSARC